MPDTCTRCFKSNETPSYQQCPRCRESARRANRTLRARRSDDAECIRCGRPSEDKTCGLCRAQLKEYRDSFEKTHGISWAAYVTASRERGEKK